MAKLLKLTTCLFLQSDPFGPRRLCFVEEKPGEKEPQPKAKPIDLTKIGTEISEEESEEALGKLKEGAEQRKKVEAETKGSLAALRAELGEPGKPKEKPEEEKKKEEKKKEEPKLSEAEKEKLKNGPRIPERAKDAMDGSQLMEAFKQCKSHEERQILILDQLAKGNVPDSFRTFQKIKVERNGQTVEFLAAPSGLRLGTDTDSIEFPMNGPLAQAVADATGCELPTKWMVDRMYEDGQKNGQFIPFTPQVFSREDAARMRTPAFIQTHDEKYKEWAREHNIDLTKPIFGYFKHVVQQSPEQRAKPHEGGNLDIYGGIFRNGNIVEPGGVGHNKEHDDYSQNVQLIAQTVYINGKPMKLADFLADSDMAGTFGFPPQPKENRYAIPAWMQERVAAIQKLTPGPVGTVEAAKPAPVFEGIDEEKLKKGKVTDDYDYTLVHGKPGGHMTFIQTDEGHIGVVEYEGQKKQVKVDLANNSGVTQKDFKDYEPSSDGVFANRFGYAMLRYFGDHGAKPGDIVPFEYGGKKYVAQYQIHPPDASAPTDHPGVGILVKKDSGSSSDIPRGAPVPAGPGEPGTPKPETPKPGPLPQIAEDMLPRPKKVGGGYRAAPGYGPAVSYGGGAGPGPSYAPASYQAPNPAPGVTYAPPVAPTPSPEPPKVAPKETREGGEYVIKGATLFLGDSNTVGAFNRANINVEGNIHTIAKGSMDAEWVLTQLKEFETTGELKNFKNMVVTVGVNGIGRGAAAIFNTLKQIWEIGKKHGVKVYAGTLAPFKGWHNFGANYEKYNQTRKDINRMIRESHAKEGVPTAIIPYDELCADPNDPDKLAPEYDSGDFLHIKKQANAKLVASVVGERVGGTQPGTPPEQKPETGPEGGVANFEKSPYFEERTKTYAFPEGDPNPLRIHINAPGNYDKSKPTRVVMYALPAGNTIEQTIGTTKKTGQDWHFEIQQIGAQTRKLREASPGENIVVAYVEGPNLNPGSWHKDDPERGALFGKLIEDVKTKVGAPAATVDISSHSAGRSFQGSYIDGMPQIPNEVKRLSFLDSIHNFNTARGDKMAAWLKAAEDHYLTVISYDDRNVELNGRPVPGAVGYVRTLEMVEQFQKQGITLTREQKNGYVHYTGLNGRVNILVMDNPGNKILHTETVFRNGFIYSQTAGTELDGKAGTFNGPLAFEKYIQPESPALAISKEQQPEKQPEAPPAISQLDAVEYQVSGGAPGGTLTLFSDGAAKMTYQSKEYDLKADPNYLTPDLAKPPKGYTVYENPPQLIAVMDYAMLHAMLKAKKPQGTEMPFEYQGVRYIAKLAWHKDHPGADLYVSQGSIA